MSTTKPPKDEPRQDPKPRQKYKKPQIQRNNDFSEHLERQIRSNKKYNGSSLRKNQISINHLLEFSLYKDLPEYHQLHARTRRHSANTNRPRRPRLHLHGMRFINVNYKFVVDYRNAYRPQQLDPNIPVETLDIIAIIAPKGNACPICLSDDLVAPRMITSCGHILCLPCLLSLLESEVPTSMKKESKVVVEKYRDCPLCGSIIRKTDVKPVLIENVDDRFEVPKVNDEVVLTLMARNSDSVVPYPRYSEMEHQKTDSFPWASQASSNQHLRFFRGDFAYVVSMYDAEKEQLAKSAEADKEMYGDDGTYYRLANRLVDEDVSSWATKFSADQPSSHQGHRSDDAPQSTFYYYQTGFRSSATYVLSSLDMNVLKASYHGLYTSLPYSVIGRVENIRYEELDTETAGTKYKFLSHLPLGTQIGFLECNWQGNEYISQDLWQEYQAVLSKRSKTSSKKLRKEDADKRRALNEEERRAREFYHRENNGDSHEQFSDWADGSAFGSLSIRDFREQPLFSGDTPTLSSNRRTSGSSHESEVEPEQGEIEHHTSVWGTLVPKSESQILADEEDAWEAEEMIRRAREEVQKQEGGKKKKKKKLILISS